MCLLFGEGDGSLGCEEKRGDWTPSFTVSGNLLSENSFRIDMMLGTSSSIHGVPQAGIGASYTLSDRALSLLSSCSRPCLWSKCILSRRFLSSLVCLHAPIFSFLSMVYALYISFSFVSLFFFIRFSRSCPLRHNHAIFALGKILQRHFLFLPLRL